MRFLLLLVSYLVLHLALHAQVTRSMPINGKYGLVRPCYPHIVAAPIYDEITHSLGSLCFIVNYKGWLGVLDTLGREKIKPELYTGYSTLAERHGDGYYYYLYDNSNQNVLINQTGNTIATNVYPIVEKSLDLLIVQVSRSDSLQDKTFFKENEKPQVKQGIMDLKGNWLIKPEARTYSFVTNYCIAVEEILSDDPITVGSHKFTLLNRKGVPIMNEQFTSVNDATGMHDSIVNLKVFFAKNENFEMRFDSMGRVISKKPLNSSNVHRQKENPTGKWGAMSDGKWILKPAYDEMSVTQQYIFGYDKTKKTTDIFDKKGNLLLHSDYEEIYVSTTKEKNEAKEFFFALKNKALYLLDQKFAVVSMPMSQIETELLYSKNDSILFLFGVNKKFGVMNQSGKVIIPPIHKNEPSVQGNVITVTNAKQNYDVYDLAGVLTTTNVFAIKTSSLNPNLYFITRASGIGIYSLKPIKAIVPPGLYSSFLELPRFSLAIGFKKDKKFIFDKNFTLLTKTPLNKVATDREHDSTLLLTNELNKKYLVDVKLNKLSDEYDFIYDFYNKGLNSKYMVCSEKKYGLIDYRGKMIINCEYDTIERFENIAYVKQGDSGFFTDSNYVVDKTLRVDAFNKYWTEYGILYKTNNKWRFLNHKEPDFEFDELIYGSYNPVLQVKKSGKWGIYDIAEKSWLVKPNFDSIVSYVSGSSSFMYPAPDKIYITKKGEKFHFVDAASGTLTGNGYDHLKSMNVHGFTPSPYYSNFLVNTGGVASPHIRENIIGGKYSIVSHKNTVLHPPDGDNVVPLVFEYSAHEWTSLIGFLWNTGGTAKEYISRVSDSVLVEHVDGPATKVPGPVTYDRKISGGKFGIVSPTGKEILPTVYDEIRFLVTLGESMQGVRINFTEAMPWTMYQKLLLYPVFLRQDSKYGAADLTGKTILPMEYDSIRDNTLNNKPVIQAWKKGLFGYYTLEGKELVTPEFTGERVYRAADWDEDGTTLLQKGGSVSTYSFVAEKEIWIYTEDGTETQAMEKDTFNYQQFTGGKYGFFNQAKLTWELNPEYDDMRFYYRYSTKRDGDKDFKLSVTEKYTCPANLNLKPLMPFVEIKKSGKWGIYQLKKGIIAEAIYDEVSSLPATSAFIVKLNGKSGVLNAEGKTVLKQEYDEISLEENSFYKATQGGAVKFFNSDGSVKQ